MAWHLDVEERVAWIRLAAPEPPTVTYRDLGELENVLASLDVATRVVVITGSRPDGFIRHADLNYLWSLGTGLEPTGDGSAWGRVLRTLDRGPFITIAAINGDAWGGGCELALSCNLRWMSDDVTLGFPEVRLGLVPGVGAHRAARLLPEHLAFEMLSGLEPLTAERASRYNLINGVLPAAQLDDEVARIARRLASLPAGALDVIRTLVQNSRDLSTRDQQRYQLTAFMDLLKDPQALELVDRARSRYAEGHASGDALGFAHD